MKVTDKQYSMENRLVITLNLMLKRMTDRYKKDNLLLIDGDEGDGKTNMSCGVGYYIAYKTQRSFSSKNFFFKLDSVIDFALKNERQVIIWDEGALGGLSDEWWNKAQTRLIKLLMVCRKKRHFFIINIPRFFKLREYLAVDRSIGLIHVYSHDGLDIGRFVYYTKQKKEKLFENYKTKKKKDYKKYYSFRGVFGYVLPKLINEQEYDALKDKGIMSLLVEKPDRHLEKMKALQYKISQLKSIKRPELAKGLGVSTRTILRWALINNTNNSLSNSNKTADSPTYIIKKVREKDKLGTMNKEEYIKELSYESINI